MANSGTQRNESRKMISFHHRPVFIVKLEGGEAGFFLHNNLGTGNQDKKTLV